jgi:hypothetical protein
METPLLHFSEVRDQLRQPQALVMKHLTETIEELHTPLFSKLRNGTMRVDRQLEPNCSGLSRDRRS